MLISVVSIKPSSSVREPPLFFLRSRLVTSLSPILPSYICGISTSIQFTVASRCFAAAKMNVFRLVGDMTHLLSLLLLLLKIYASKSCSGISLKTQELFAIVFLARYLDLFTEFISIYNTVMNLIFIGSTLAIVLCMRFHRVVKRSYDRELDTFRHYYLVGASFLLALFLHEKFTFQEIFRAFSIHLEAVAILPQLVLLQKLSNRRGHPQS